jgi:hypothetical protein
MTHDNAFKALCDHADHLTGIASQPDLRKRLEQLLDDAFTEMMTADRRTDPMFGSHAATVALSHHAYGCEARLIEQATVLVCEEQPHLQVVRLDRAIPLVEAAWQALRGNDWSELEGIRLPSRVFAEDSYMPDLVVIDRRSRDLFLFDIKRSVDSKPSRARGLMEKLKAAALVAPDWLARWPRSIPSPVPASRSSTPPARSTIRSRASCRLPRSSRCWTSPALPRRLPRCAAASRSGSSRNWTGCRRQLGPANAANRRTAPARKQWHLRPPGH